MVKKPCQPKRGRRSKPNQTNTMKTEHKNNIVESCQVDKTQSVALSAHCTIWQALEYTWLDIAELSRKKRMSSWQKGVWHYTSRLYFSLNSAICKGCKVEDINELLLNGAQDWKHASESGGYYVCNADIAETLLPPSQRARLTNNYKALELQGRALAQAAQWLKSRIRFYMA